MPERRRPILASQGLPPIPEDSESSLHDIVPTSTLPLSRQLHEAAVDQLSVHHPFEKNRQSLLSRAHLNVRVLELSLATPASEPGSGTLRQAGRHDKPYREYAFAIHIPCCPKDARKSDCLCCSAYGDGTTSAYEVRVRGRFSHFRKVLKPAVEPWADVAPRCPGRGSPWENYTASLEASCVQQRASALCSYLESVLNLEDEGHLIRSTVRRACAQLRTPLYPFIGCVACRSSTKHLGSSRVPVVCSV